MTAQHEVLRKIQFYLSGKTDILDNGENNGGCILSEEERAQYRHLMKECPAFQTTNNTKNTDDTTATEQQQATPFTCPFKNVEDAQTLKQELLNIPESHKKCPAFSHDRDELKFNKEDKHLIENLFVFRWDLFFDEPLKDFGLCRELRRRTTKKHVEAESVPFIKRFIKYDICPYQYRVYLANLYLVYEALEPALDEVGANHKFLKRIHFPRELRRLEGLERDLEYFYGKDWRKVMTVLPSTQRYTDRINYLRSEPDLHHLLVAHSSTRYLGDLYGGQQLMKKSKTALKLPGNFGTQFYNFEYIKQCDKYKGSTNQFRSKYEKRMNKLPVTAKECEEIVEEANLVFELNMHVFEDIDRCQDLLAEDKKKPMTPSGSKATPLAIALVGGLLILLAALIAAKYVM